MSATDTRNESYFAHRDSGKLGAQHRLILDRMRASNAKFGPHDFSLREIAANTRLEINAVSGRVHELKDLGELVECRKRPCRVTGRMVTPVALPGTVSTTQEAAA